MRHVASVHTAISICALVAAAAAPTSVFAGVMPMLDKASISLQSPTDVVDWRSYMHRHHRWHPGWHWGRGPGMTHWGYARRFGYAAPAWGYAGAGYPSCGYGTWGYSPAGGLLGAATDVAASPLWAAGAATGPFWGW